MIAPKKLFGAGPAQPGLPSAKLPVVLLELVPLVAFRREMNFLSRLTVTVPAQKQRDPVRAVTDDVLDRRIVVVLPVGLGGSEFVDERVEFRELLDGDVEQLLFAGCGDDGPLAVGDSERRA